MDAMLHKHNLTIGCLSSQAKLQNVFRSMIRVLSQFTQSGLHKNWIYQDQQPLDVYILDLDDQRNRDLIASNPQFTVIAISSQPDLLDGQKHSLNKPLRSQSLLQVLKDIERGFAGKTLLEARPHLEKIGQHDSITEIASQPIEPSIPLHPQPKTVASVYELHTWPQLTLVPDAVVFDVARICALLSQQACSAQTLADVLGLSAEQTERALALIAQYAPDSLTTNTQVVHTSASTAPSTKPSSFLAKIWNKLKGAA